MTDTARDRVKQAEKIQHEYALYGPDNMGVYVQRSQDFETWLAAEVTAAKAEAWDEGYKVGGEDWQSEYWSSRRTGKTNPYRAERTTDGV